MMNLRTRVGLGAIVVGALAVSATGCAGAQQQPTIDPSASVTITVGDLPSTKAEAARKNFLDSVDAFEKANPNITVEPSETRWDNGSFSALVAGGTMPTVMSVPFTNTQQVIENGQVADLTDVVNQLGMLDRLNPDTLKPAQADGKTYGIPTTVDTVALMYNRDLFKKAGLDPDKPPATWDEVRTAAKAITKATGNPGYLQITQEGQAGWIYTASVYSRGGTIENEAGDQVTIDNPASIAALQSLRDMFSADKTMGSSVIMDLKTIMQEFAAGRAGMFVAPVASYEWLNNVYDMDLSVIGASHLPQGDAAGSGTPLGGNVQMANPKSTPEQLLAAAKWVDFYYFGKFTSKDTAVANAQALVKDGGIVGLPGLSPLSADAYKQYRDWIADDTNVDASHFTSYTDSLTKIPLIPEPATRAQEVYADLASTVQAVMSDPSAPIEPLVKDAASRLERIISQ